MLAQPVLSSFIENSLTGKILPSGILPVNNNPSLVEIANFNTAVVVDKDGQTPVAMGIMTKCNARQAYCMVGKVADKYARHSVSVEQVEEEGEDNQKHAVYKVVDSFEGSVDKSLMRPYHAVFEDEEKKFLEVTLADSLFEQTLGTFNMDMEKNITIDIVGVDNQNLDIWRDRSGFVVSDSNKFVQMTVSKTKMMDVFSDVGSKTDAAINQIGKDNISDVLDFDETVTMYQRSTYLNYLIGQPQIRAFVATSGPGCVSGYALASPDRVLQCYAETSETAAKLLTTVASTSPSDEITFFANSGVNSLVDGLQETATNVDIVTRLHTRTKNVQVKWPLVTIANIGLSIL